MISCQLCKDPVSKQSRSLGSSGIGLQLGSLRATLWIAGGQRSLGRAQMELRPERKQKKKKRIQEEAEQIQAMRVCWVKAVRWNGLSSSRR